MFFNKYNNKLLVSGFIFGLSIYNYYYPTSVELCDPGSPGDAPQGSPGDAPQGPSGDATQGTRSEAPEPRQ